MKIHDISLPISNTMVTYEGDPGVHISRRSDFAKGDPMTLSDLEMGAHTGTHVDAPLHFIPGGRTVDQLDLNVLVGPALVVELKQVQDAIHSRDLDGAQIPEGTTRLLAKTRNEELWDKKAFQENFLAFALDGAQWLIDHGIRLVGIDYLSIEPYETPGYVVHRALLGAGIVVVEGLYLRDVAPGEYELTCLPIKLQGAEGAPARAVLIER